MSFDMTPSMNLSNVQASAKSCPGGGGNTGYFQRNGEEEDDNHFAKTKAYPDDSFEKQEIILEDVPEEESFLTILRNFIMDLIEALSGLFKKGEN